MDPTVASRSPFPPFPPPGIQAMHLVAAVVAFAHSILGNEVKEAGDFTSEHLRILPRRLAAHPP